MSLNNLDESWTRNYSYDLDGFNIYFLTPWLKKPKPNVGGNSYTGKEFYILAGIRLNYILRGGIYFTMQGWHFNPALIVLERRARLHTCRTYFFGICSSCIPKTILQTILTDLKTWSSHFFNNVAALRLTRDFPVARNVVNLKTVSKFLFSFRNLNFSCLFIALCWLR